MKFNNDANDIPGGSISNILYENITMIDPIQYPIWIGPAQQADTVNICEANPCSLCWPYLKPFVKCNVPKYGNYTNITLKDVFIKSSKYLIPGVLMGSPMHKIKNLILDNVSYNLNTTFLCENVDNITLKNGSPKQICVKHRNSYWLFYFISFIFLALSSYHYLKNIRYS